MLLHLMLLAVVPWMPVGLGLALGALVVLAVVFQRWRRTALLAQRLLAQQEQRYRELVEFLPELIFEIDANGDLVFFNHAAYTIFGATPEMVTPRFNVLERLAPSERERALANIRLVASGQVIGPQEYTALHYDGTPITARFITKAITDHVHALAVAPRREKIQ